MKSEIQLLEKNDFTMMKAENDRLMGEVEKLRQKLREEITRSQANVRLDLHLEKGRIRDEASAQEIKIKETDTRIESEIAGLRTQMEAIKFQILQYMIGNMLMHQKTKLDALTPEIYIYTQVRSQVQEPCFSPIFVCSADHPKALESTRPLVNLYPPISLSLLSLYIRFQKSYEWRLPPSHKGIEKFVCFATFK